MKYNCEIINLAGGRRIYVSPAIKELNWEIEKGFATSTQFQTSPSSTGVQEMSVEEVDWWGN